MASVTLRRGPSKKLVAAETADPVLQFSVAKSLPYRARIAWILGLAAAGVLLQVAFLMVWPGLPFLVAAMALSFVAGFDNRVDRRGPVLDGVWEDVPLEKVREIPRLDRSIARWDASAIDITSGGGALLFLLLGGALLGGSVLLGVATDAGVGSILLVDGALLLLAQWFSGIRTTFRQPDLVLKVKALERAAADCEEAIAGYGEPGGLLQMSDREGERWPLDVKMAVRPKEPPDAVTGVQVQVVLNRVQGRPYPYLYAVVLAGKDSGLLRGPPEGSGDGSVIVETVDGGDVDALVVRQHTTKTSGYHTKPKAAARVLEHALGIASADLARRRAAP